METEQSILDKILALTTAEKALGTSNSPDVNAILQISGMIQDLQMQLAALQSNPNVPGLSDPDVQNLQNAKDALSAAVSDSDNVSKILIAATALKNA